VTPPAVALALNCAGSTGAHRHRLIPFDCVTVNPLGLINSGSRHKLLSNVKSEEQGS
jgi:hypothetical protein